MALEIFDRLFTDGQYAITLLRGIGGICLHRFKDVGVVAASQAAVAGNYDIQAAASLALGKIRAAEFRIRSGNIKQGGVQRLKVGAAMFYPLLRAAQLAGAG